MTGLLIISIIGTILFGYFIICRISKSIESGRFIDSPQGRANHGILVYGVADVAKKISEHGIKCQIVTDLVIPENGFFSALFALSANDMDNLMICCAAKKADPDIYIIAWCNDVQHDKIFIEVGASYVLSPHETIDGLLSELWRSHK